jgi:hypothetical protein
MRWIVPPRCSMALDEGKGVMGGDGFGNAESRSFFARQRKFPYKRTTLLQSRLQRPVYISNLAFKVVIKNQVTCKLPCLPARDDDM